MRVFIKNGDDMKALIEQVNINSKIKLDIDSVEFDQYMFNASYHDISVARYSDKYGNYILIPEMDGESSVGLKWQDFRTLNVSQIFPSEHDYCDALHINNIYILLDNMAY